MVPQFPTEDTPGGVEGLLAARQSPLLTIFRTARQCSKYPNWVSICVTGGFLMSVNSDIKCPQSGLDTYYATYRCKNLGRHVQPVPLGTGFRLDPSTFWGPATALVFLRAQF